MLLTSTPPLDAHYTPSPPRSVDHSHNRLGVVQQLSSVLTPADALPCRSLCVSAALESCMFEQHVAGRSTAAASPCSSAVYFCFGRRCAAHVGSLHLTVGPFTHTHSPLTRCRCLPLLPCCVLLFRRCAARLGSLHLTVGPFTHTQQPAYPLPLPPPAPLLCTFVLVGDAQHAWAHSTSLLVHSHTPSSLLTHCRCLPLLPCCVLLFW